MTITPLRAMNLFVGCGLIRDQIVGARKHTLIICVASLLSILFSTAYSDELQSSGREYPYTRENPKHDSLIHWKEPVRLEVLGATTAAEKFYAASLISSAARLALTHLELVGENASWFAEKTLVNPVANYVIIFIPDIADKPAINQSDVLASGFDASTAHPAVQDLLNKGVARLGSGCYGGWKASQENEVSGFVIIADPKLEARRCLKSVSISSFGVEPVVTLIEFPGKPRVALESESHLFLIISGYCRKGLRDNSFQCPARFMAAVEGN